MAIEKELFDQLLAGRDPGELFAEYGLIDGVRHPTGVTAALRSPPQFARTISGKAASIAPRLHVGGGVGSNWRRSALLCECASGNASLRRHRYRVNSA